MLGRSRRHITRRLQPSTHGRPLRTSIGYMSTLRSSTKRAGPLERRNATSIVLGKSLTRRPKSTSRLSMSLPRCGASGRRWRFVKSESTLRYELASTNFHSRNYDEAIRVMQRAAVVPKNTKINYFDHVRLVLLPHPLVKSQMSL